MSPGSKGVWPLALGVLGALTCVGTLDVSYSCLEAREHLEECCGKTVSAYCGGERSCGSMCGFGGDEPTYPDCEPSAGFSLREAEYVLGLECDEVRRRDLCTVTAVHAATGRESCGIDLAGSWSPDWWHWPHSDAGPDHARPDLAEAPDLVELDLPPPDLAEPDLPVLCAAGCPACPDGTVCARDLRPNLLPTCVERCVSSRDCPTGTTCIDWLGSDGRPLALPACFPSLRLWCGETTICRADAPPPRCRTAKTLEVYFYENAPDGRPKCVGDGYLIEDCPQGCETLGPQGGRCR